MPMTPSAVASGRGLADLIVACAELTILAVTALAIGWRSSAGLLDTLLAFGLLLLLRFSLIWVGVFLGLVVPTPEAAGGLCAVRRDGVPRGDRGQPARHQGRGHEAFTATRELFGNPGAGGASWVEQNAALTAVAWPVAISLIFLPLAVRKFKQLSR